MACIFFNVRHKFSIFKAILPLIRRFRNAQVHNLTMIRSLFILLLLVLSGGSRAVWAQPLQWDLTYGGESYEELNAVLVVADGIVAGGSSKSNIAFGRPLDYSWNILLIKTNFDGQVIWRRFYGGDQDERLWTMIRTADGGFLCGGYSYSGINGDKTQPNRGDMDVWLLKLDADGQLEWDKTYGGTFRDELFALLEIPNGGGYILGAHSNSNISGEKSEMSRGNQDFWLLQIDQQGNKVWDKTLGGDGYEQLHDLAWAADGTVYASGGTLSAANTGEVGTDAARGGMDFWLVKFNPVSRQLVWSHRYGGTGEDYPYSLIRTRNGGVLLGGRSGSVSGSGDKTTPFYGGDSDYWLLQINDNGQKNREWSFGGSGLDDLYYIQENEVGQVVVGGVSDSGISGNKTTAGHGSYDYWTIGLDKNGNKSWEKNLGGTDGDAFTKIARRPNGALVYGGHSFSNSGFEKTQNSFGETDFWLVSALCEATVAIVETEVPIPCSNQPLNLGLNIQNCVNCAIVWNTADTATTIEVTPQSTPTSFNVLIYNEYGCIATDTFTVAAFEPNLVVELAPAAITLPSGQTVTLGTAHPGWQYSWSTGATTATLVVSTEGTYTVTITAAGGCTATDSVTITLEDGAYVYVPNAFSPNNDGVHDWVTIYIGSSVRRVVSFQIFDRWGEHVYSRKDFVPDQDVEGWDGRYRDKWLPPDVFVWFALVEFQDGRQQLYEGSVTLIR